MLQPLLSLWRGPRGKLLEACLLGLAFALYLVPLQDRVVLFVFQVRDIARTYELLKGHLIFFGPEITGGGHLPGALYYYLLALPLSLGLGWKGPWLLLTLFQGAAAGTLWYFFRTRFEGVLPALFAFLCFASAYPVSVGILLVLNAAFIFPFAAVLLAAVTLAYSRDASETTRAKALAAAFFTLALGLQLHLSLIAFLPAILVLQLLGGRAGLARLPGKAFLRALLFLFPLLPFLVWREARDLGHPFGQLQPPFAGIKGLGNFVFKSYGNFTLVAWEANRYFGFWYAVKEFLLSLHRFVLDLGGLTVPGYLVVLAWLGTVARRILRRETASPADGRVLALFLCAFFGFGPGLVGAGAGAMAVRYFGVSSVTYLVFVAAAFARVLACIRAPSWPATARGRAIAAVALAAFSLAYLAHFGARSQRVANLYASGWGYETVPPASEFESLSRAVVAKTGWSYERFRERAFVVNVFNEITLQTNYEEVEGGAAAQPGAPDGYFVAKRMSGDDYRASTTDPKGWLMKQRLPASLVEGLQSGGITLGEADAFGSLLLLPYRVKDLQRYSPYFQNRSEHYENAEEARVDAALKEQAEAPERVRVAVFNDCPGEAWFCRFAMVARSRDLGDPAEPLTVEVLGLPLSQASQHISPAWTQAIYEPYLSYECGGGARKVTLAPAVGFYTVDNWILNHSFLAPYRRELKLDCGGGKNVDRLALGYKSSTAISDLKETAYKGAERVFAPQSRKRPSAPVTSL